MSEPVEVRLREVSVGLPFHEKAAFSSERLPDTEKAGRPVGVRCGPVPTKAER